MRLFLCLFSVSLLVVSGTRSTYAKENDSRPSAICDCLHAAHAPIAVMGDHTHQEGETMFSYRYMHMEMAGMRNGTDRISSANVLTDFMVSPTEMTMDMHMLGVMHALTETTTWMVMIPWLDKEMDHVTRMGGRFTTETDGLGDISLSALLVLCSTENSQAILNLGISVPSGSIDERDSTPMGADTLLPYPMQLGSGTYDLRPGITWVKEIDALSGGAQARAVFPLGENDEYYAVGDQYALTAWVGWEPISTVNTSLRLSWQSWDDISGADDRLNPMVVPTAQPDFLGGDRLDILLGLSVLPEEGLLAGHRLAIEFGWVVEQDTDGPQLETDTVMTLGWQKSW